MWPETCGMCFFHEQHVLSRTAGHAMLSKTGGMFCHEQHGMQCGQKHMECFHEQHGIQSGQKRVKCFVINSMACNVVRDVWNILS